MKMNKIVFCLVLILMLASMAYAAKAVPTTGTKKLDLSKYHNVGNIWLRVSNYGFFGSGDDIVPQYPSLEYPGGSGIDYLYQGALWFGAKKQRRDGLNRKLYWKVYPPSASNDTILYEGEDGWTQDMKPVLDTLVTVGFDGDADLYEFLPAYNPLLVSNAAQADNYTLYNAVDGIASASTRQQKRGVDDDGDGRIDEDFVGYTFPFRLASELPAQFSTFGGQHLANMPSSAFSILDDPSNAEIWFPLGFMDLADRSYTSYAFTASYDDDRDGRRDEDGAPVSEQDFISYYYDYCPFGTEGDRDHGQSRGSNKHYPLNVRIRQMSYQWSYDYIKNLVYVEFNITNMNADDELIDCAMGIYMDADVGPQTWGVEKASDDLSGYVKGEGYEFAYTRDEDGDGGLTTGLVGARVCTPDPENLEFHCWYWKVGQGPDDGNPRSLTPTGRTANEKYWLLTGKNPNTSYYTPLRPGDGETATEFEQPSPNDTRFLFAFYGAQPGTPEYDEVDEHGDYFKRWNLAPGKTMKIVVAVFPGENKEDLKRTARWAKEIYGQAQDLITVVLPDTFPHYNPPEPPAIPALHAELMDNGNRIDLYWDNRSEFTYDVKTVSTAIMGWQFPGSSQYKPGLDSDPAPYENNWPDEFPLEFRTDFGDGFPWNNNALANPWTAYRLRHDFQGYSVWGRSGSGSQEDWEMINRWDKIDTPQDLADYSINADSVDLFLDFGGYLGIDNDLPNRSDLADINERGWQADPAEYARFYRLNEYYDLVPNGSVFYGWPIYDPDKDWTPEIQSQADQILADNPMLSNEEQDYLQAKMFMHPDLIDYPERFASLYDPKLIPLKRFAFPDGEIDPTAEELTKLEKERLARRYYRSSIHYPRKGIEYYVAVTAFDRGIPSNDLNFLETGRDSDANMKVFFPGTLATEKMDDIKVVPNPYIGRSKFDGRYDNDEKGDKSRRLWFINLPNRCKIRIYTLAGDLVKTIDHDGAQQTDIVTISKATTQGIAASGMHAWDLLSQHNQIIAPGVYLFSVENKADDKLKVGKFVIIK
ncbi:MAG: hypothetical protein PHU99_04825 [Candidatus Cloacimonetes bacterium]|jgi:hypothetical protein|nr:hypothetical protein [Candidatus Cloacimonadota bacterium]MDY0337171.1 hypothetical protein [Candidatus Cloacimonadaceae bacterium]MCK9333691.1 hypothetical protein [Candidatus Cloacimonadota bacterium]MDD2543559.1 hypothetical protein [Candidatus Cloacimonadota bacterium]MDD2682518.1 hypothetical protein [Candidatus Cloacimonadota bacterium]